MIRRLKIATIILAAAFCLVVAYGALGATSNFTSSWAYSFLTYPACSGMITTNCISTFTVKDETFMPAVAIGTVSAPALSLTATPTLTPGPHSFGVIANGLDGSGNPVSSGVSNTAIAPLAAFLVSPFGSDSNPGTLSLPFLTLQAAITAAGTSTVTLLPGNYYGANAGAGAEWVVPAPVTPAASPSSFPTGVFAVLSNNTTNGFLIPQANVAGDVDFVTWATVNPTLGVYNWQSVENNIAPWWAAGKKTGLVIWNVTTPSFVLAQLAPTLTCSGAPGAVPNFTSPQFQSAYATFLAALFAKYGNDQRIAYIRVGTGGDGETYPSCTAAQAAAPPTGYGLTQAAWQSYTLAMMSAVHAVAGSVPIMFALSCYGTPCPNSNPYGYPTAVAALAVQYGFIFGKESLQDSDQTAYGMGQPCGANWCALFAEYPSSPHGLQFGEPTCADNDCTIGSPINLLPFASARGADFVEMVSGTDLTIAYGPTPGPYTAAYQTAITNFVTAVQPAFPPAPSNFQATVVN